MDLTNSCGTLRDAINDEVNSNDQGGDGDSVAYADYDQGGDGDSEPEYAVAMMVNDDDDVNMGQSIGNELPMVSKPKLKLRNYFPESWLFELVVTGKNGVFSREMYSPHTMTEWQGEAVCINREEGLGVASPQPLLVTQDFFTQLSLPYSVKRGEGFPLNISVFN